MVRRSRDSAGPLPLCSRKGNPAERSSSRRSPQACRYDIPISLAARRSDPRRSTRPRSSALPSPNGALPAKVTQNFAPTPILGAGAKAEAVEACVAALAGRRSSGSARASHLRQRPAQLACSVNESPSPTRLAWGMKTAPARVLDHLADDLALDPVLAAVAWIASITVP